MPLKLKPYDALQICLLLLLCTSLQTDNHTNTSSLNFYKPTMSIESNILIKAYYYNAMHLLV